MTVRMLFRIRGHEARRINAKEAFDGIFCFRPNIADDDIETPLKELLKNTIYVCGTAKQLGICNYKSGY